MSEKIMAWHFTCGKKLRDGRRLAVGRTYRLPKGVQPVLFHTGYHACRSILEALWRAPGLQLSRVKLGGTIIKQNEIYCATERTVLWAVDADMVIRKAAVVFAERALAARKKAGKEVSRTDKRTLALARAYLNGKATEAEVIAEAQNAGALYCDAAFAAAGDYPAVHVVDVASAASAIIGRCTATPVDHERAWQERYLRRAVERAWKAAHRPGRATGLSAHAGSEIREEE